MAGSDGPERLYLLGVGASATRGTIWTGSQMRRASVSVPSNIAEGQSHGSDGRYIAHVRIAIGSLGELSTELELAQRLKFLTAADLSDVERQLVSTRRLLFGLLRSLRKKRLSRAASKPRTTGQPTD